MGAAVSNLACHIVGNLYPSYTSYRALKYNASNVELVSRLITWVLVNLFLTFTARVTDPTFGRFLPFYYPAKLALVAWMVHPRAQGAYYLFIKHIEPAIRDMTEGLEQQPAVD